MRNRRWTEAAPPVMIIGGDKTGEDRFCERNVKTAEDLWDQHFAEKAWEREPDDD